MLQALMGKVRQEGFTILEVLIAAGLFTIVLLGMTQTNLILHRYAQANLCKLQAHLFAVSLFEQLLCEKHPYELVSDNTSTSTSINLRNLQNPINTSSISLRTNLTTLNSNSYFTYTTHGMDAPQFKIFLQLIINMSPLYNDYGARASTKINPPEGFQSLHLKYAWESPTATNLSDATTWPSNELYAIRPIMADDPENENIMKSTAGVSNT